MIEKHCRPDRATYEVAKRAFDIHGALTGIVVLSPVLAGLAAAVKFTSPGPIFYRGTRTGRNGKPFRILKFRSMVVGADHGAGSTSRNDPRVTRIGRVLRRYKLDELPQLFNVLRGDMSFVGPRPELPQYTRLYTDAERVILTVRPGITDYSSIQFANLNDLVDDDDPDASFEKKVLPEKNRLRVKYVEDRSFLLDLKLMLKTALRVVGME